MSTTDKKADKNKIDEGAVLAAIAEMPEHDRLIGEKLHVIIKQSGPGLMSRTWYGMPAYTNGNKIVLFFRSGKKFGERYMTIGFNDVARLDDGNMWPINYALAELTPDIEDEVAGLVKKAVS